MVDHDKASIPIPDPTALTTAALDRQISSLKELLFTRLDNSSRENEVFIDRILELGNKVKEEVRHLENLHNEKFAGITLQFLERDTRAERADRDGKAALAAALQAAKEAVTEQNKSAALAIEKSSAATAKQMDQQGIQIATATQALEDKISGVKELINKLDSRITSIESLSIGRSSSVTESRAVGGYVVAAAGVAFGILVGIVSLVVTFMRESVIK
jgi:Fe2+ transport system protein B